MPPTTAPKLPYYLTYGQAKALAESRGLGEHTFRKIIVTVERRYPVPGTGPNTGHRAKYLRDDVMRALG